MFKKALLLYKHVKRSCSYYSQHSIYWDHDISFYPDIQVLIAKFAAAEEPKLGKGGGGAGRRQFWLTMFFSEG